MASTMAYSKDCIEPISVDVNLYLSVCIVQAEDVKIL